MLFAPKKVDPKQQVREMKRNVTKEIRKIEREILGIEREEMKLKKEIRMAAKRGDMQTAKILARDVVLSRKAKERLFCGRAHLNSVSMQLQSNLATMRMVGSIAASVEVMQSMNNLIKLPQFQKIAMALSREMEKAGIIEEMIEDVFEDMDEEEENAADEEVEKVFLEITTGKLDDARPVPRTKLEAENDENDEKELDDDEIKMHERINAL